MLISLSSLYYWSFYKLLLYKLFDLSEILLNIFLLDLFHFRFSILKILRKFKYRFCDSIPEASNSLHRWTYYHILPPSTRYYHLLPQITKFICLLLFGPHTGRHKYFVELYLLTKLCSLPLKLLSWTKCFFLQKWMTSIDLATSSYKSSIQR